MIGVFYAALVALAEQQHGVARSCQLHGCTDRFTPVRDEPGRRRPGDEAAGDVLEDHQRILAARVLIRKDHDVGVLGGDSALHGPLLAILLSG